MAGEHSVLSPSSAHRRVRCVGSLAACKGIPNESTRFAAEGAAYHEVAADVLACNDIAWSCADWIGRDVEADGFTFTINEEDAAHAQTYVDAVRRLPGEQMYEVRLDTSLWLGIPGQGGTGDCVTLDYENATIHVDDLKFGRGEVVYAEGNEQLLEYAAAALRMFDMLCDWKHVRVGIHQPRIGHYDEHTYTVAEVEAFIERVRPLEQAAHLLWASGTPGQIRDALTPSTKGCRWCPLNGKCVAQREQMASEFATVAQADDKTRAMFAMSDAELAEERDRVEFLENYAKAVKEEAFQRASAGREIPGWELADGRAGARKWSDASQVESTLVSGLQDAAYEPRELISPAVAEKKLKKHSSLWDTLQQWITQAPPSKTLVRSGGKHKAPRQSKTEFKPAA